MLSFRVTGTPNLRLALLYPGSDHLAKLIERDLGRLQLQFLTQCRELRLKLRIHVEDVLATGQLRTLGCGGQPRSELANSSLHIIAVRMDALSRDVR